MLKSVQKSDHSIKCTHTARAHHALTCTLPWTQWVASVDLFANEDAHANIVVTATDSWTQQGEEVSSSYE